MPKKRPQPRNVQIGNDSFRMCVFRLVEINGETVLKYIGLNENAQLKSDVKLNRFAVVYVTLDMFNQLEQEAQDRS